MQQLERYLGFRVTLGKSITTNAYDAHREAIITALGRAKINRDGVEIYVCHIRVEASQSHFDPSPLHDKLGMMQIHLAINKQHRDEERMYFINDRVNHTIAGSFHPKIEKFDLRYSVDGRHFADHDHFQEVVYIVVEKSVKPKDRRIKVKFLATPTSSFARKLVNVTRAKTDLDLALDPRIQLQFDM